MTYAGEMAAEIDRLVIRGHQAAAEWPDKPEMPAHPGLLNTVAIVLLAGPLARDAVDVIVPYLPRSMEAALIENNVAEGIVGRKGVDIELTAAGRDVAQAVVSV